MDRVGLIEVDRQTTFPHMKFPNLCMMKISAYHKKSGDDVSWCENGLERFDIVYQSKVFDESYSRDIDWYPNADKVIKGGTGYGNDNVLPDEIEHIYPDYALYGISETAFGYLTRGCPRGCPWCIVGNKEGRRSRHVADLSEFWNGQKNINLMDPNIMACPDRTKLLLDLADSGAWVDFSQGVDVRLCDKDAIVLLNRIKVKLIHLAWDDPRFDLEHELKRFNALYRIKDPRRKIVYILSNYNSTPEEDLHRIYTVERLGFNADLRVYYKPNAPPIVLKMQRWCNNRIIHGVCKRFEDYKEV